MAVNRVGPPDQVDQAFGQGRCGGGLRRVGLDNRELVAPKARHHVAIPYRALEPLRDFAEQRVAYRVAQRVVHSLEAIEIYIEHRRSVAGPLRAGEPLHQPISERFPIGEAGKRVSLSKFGVADIGRDIVQAEHETAARQRPEGAVEQPVVGQPEPHWRRLDPGVQTCKHIITADRTAAGEQSRQHAVNRINRHEQHLGAGVDVLHVAFLIQNEDGGGHLGQRRGSGLNRLYDT